MAREAGPAVASDTPRVYYSAKPLSFTGEPVKTTRVCLFILAASFCLSIPGLAQSNAKPDYNHQHKDAENYQKNLMKQRHKAEKAAAKKQKASLKQHQHQ